MISNCNVTAASTSTGGEVTCYAVVYYSTRCIDESATSGVNNTITSTSNSVCRKQRLTHINSALGSSTVQYTNVPSISASGTAYAVTSVYSRPFSNYTRKFSFIKI